MATRPRGKPRLYLDTSIPSAYWDDREPDRRAKTREFWEQLPSYEVFISAMTVSEAGRHPDASRRMELLGLLQPFTVLAVTGEAEARQLLAAINPLLGYPVLQIVSPLEV